MNLSPREKIGWSLFAIGGICAIGAAAQKGGTFEVLSAAAAVFNAAAVAWGIAAKASTATTSTK